MELQQACRAAGIGAVVASEHAGPPRLHRALPGLSARLVVSLGAPFEVRYNGRVAHMQAVFAGLMRPGLSTPSLVLRSHQPSVYVDLSPATVQFLTGVPLNVLDAGGVPADAVAPWVSTLSAELADQPDGRRESLMRVRLLDMLQRSGQRRWPEDALKALDLITTSRGWASVEDVARQAHLSPRRLRDVMRRDLGVTPKFALRVARLAATIDSAAWGAESWAEVAAQAGYHDQSHFVHEFHTMMDTSPTAWLAEECRNLQGWRQPSP